MLITGIRAITLQWEILHASRSCMLYSLLKPQNVSFKNSSLSQSNLLVRNLCCSNSMDTGPLNKLAAVRSVKEAMCRTWRFIIAFIKSPPSTPIWIQSTFSDFTYDEYKIIRNDAVMVYWKVVSQNLPWWTQENHKLLVRTAKLWTITITSWR
jgi:hypothetical protein